MLVALLHNWHGTLGNGSTCVEHDKLVSLQCEHGIACYSHRCCALPLQGRNWALEACPASNEPTVIADRDGLKHGDTTCFRVMSVMALSWGWRCSVRGMYCSRYVLFAHLHDVTRLLPLPGKIKCTS